MIEDTYLGDGVYASFDGYAITLDLRNQDKSKIYLEPQVFAQLIRFNGLAKMKEKYLIDISKLSNERLRVWHIKKLLELEKQ